MKKKILPISMMLVTLLGNVAACSGGSGSGSGNGSGDVKPSGQSTTAKESSATSGSSEASESSDTSATETSKAPDYINLDSALPFVKQDSTKKVKLSVYAAAQDGAKDVKDTWQWRYLQDKGNIELDIKLVPWASKDEQKNLALSTGIIPDIMYNMQLNASDLILYGTSEKMLTNLKGLIKDYAPDIQATLDNNPGFAATLTTPDEAIYSLSVISNQGKASDYAMFINKEWMDGIGMTKAPTTLDEFTNMLVQFKEKNPMGIPEDKLVPLGGYSGPDYPTAFILQALGFQIGTFRLERIYDVAVVGDRCSVICCDDLYARYLEVAKDWYDKGLISQDYFTIDWKTTRAQAGLGYCGAYPQFNMSTIISNGFVEATDDAAKAAYLEKWIACQPLTSKWNDTPVTQVSSGNSIGNFALSEACEEKEAAIRFANWFFTQEGSMLAKRGPMKGSDIETYGLLEGWYMEKDPETGEVKIRDNPQLSIYSGYFTLGYNGDNIPVGTTNKTMNDYIYELGGFPDQYTKPGEYNLNTSGGRIGKQRYDAQSPYGVLGAPSVFYFDQDTSARITDLISVVKTYADSETAKFITGKRDIKEVDAFLREIRAAGGKELNEIYNKAYQDYKARLK